MSRGTGMGPVNRIRNVKGQAWYIAGEHDWHLAGKTLEETLCGMPLDRTRDRPKITFQERWVVVQAVCPDCHRIAVDGERVRRLKR